MKTMLRFLTCSLLAFFALAPVAHAHFVPGDVHGFGSGVAHPLHGLDHMLAMVAVGLWAAQLGGRARWAVPASFVGVMTLGAAVAMAGLHVPFVEQGIMLSVMVLGLLIALAARFPLGASTTIVALFALFHGHSHGAEMPVNAIGFAYGAGFVSATVTLHACGIGLARAVRSARLPVIRWAGAAIAVMGVMLALG
jgi:urease accessory protein